MFQKPTKDTPLIYKIITPFFFLGLIIMFYGIFVGNFSVSSTGVLIMLILYFILKRKSPLKMR